MRRSGGGRSGFLIETGMLSPMSYNQRATIELTAAGPSGRGLHG